jgi:hypothetical protein
MNANRRKRYAESSRRQTERAREVARWTRPTPPRPGEFIADTHTRRKIVTAWVSGHRLEGWDRFTHTAVRAGVSVATVISVLRSSGAAA